MTALPATRQLAMRLVERLDDDKASYDALNVDIIVAESAEMDQLLALARRGAATVGATEDYAAVTERAAQIIGSEYRDPSVIEAALTWLEQRADE